MNIILQRDHIKDCWYGQGGHHSPWVLDNPAYEYLDKNGQGRGETTMWIKFRCNMPECTAAVLVNHWKFSEEIDRLINWPAKRRRR